MKIPNLIKRSIAREVNSLFINYDFKKKKDDDEDEEDDEKDDKSSKVKKEKSEPSASELLSRATRGAVIQNKTRGVSSQILFCRQVFNQHSALVLIADKLKINTTKFFFNRSVWPHIISSQ